MGCLEPCKKRLPKFVELANNINKNIQVELCRSTNKIEFLDVSIHFNNRTFTTDFNSKKTDKQKIFTQNLGPTEGN